MFGLSPWLLLGGLVGVLAAGVGGYMKGRADMDIVWLARDAMSKNEALLARQQFEEQANAFADQLAKADEAERVVFRTIRRNVDRIVERPVYRNVCFDTDGLRLVNSALAGVSVDPGLSGPAVLPAQPSR